MNDSFPNASDSFKLANPHIFHVADSIPTIIEKGFGIDGGAKMNKTEREFSFILEARKRRGEISRYDYEGITLRWGDLRYTPDFVVFPGEIESELFGQCARITFIEVKGGFIRDDALVKFKAARAYWPQLGFQMWQKIKGQWIKKL